MSLRACQAPAKDEAPKFGLVQRLFNSEWGRLATASLASLTLFGATEAGALTSPEPVTADNPPTMPGQPNYQPTSLQECIQAALVPPQVEEGQQLEMLYPGVGAPIKLPSGKQLWQQVIRGYFSFSGMPTDCASQVLRYGEGSVQMKGTKNHRIWIDVPEHPYNWGNPLYVSNDAGTAQLGVTGGHKWPDKYLNRCVRGIHGKSFLKVRDKMLNEAVDPQTKQIVAKRYSFFPVNVIGKCSYYKWWLKLAQ